MFPLIFFTGVYWLAASFWIQLGGDPSLIWASILPVAWVSSLCFLR